MRPAAGKREDAAARPIASRAPSASRRAEGGHLLIVLMVGVAALMIMLTAAAQSWTFQMRREMELELVFRGEQYVRALEAFRRLNGGGFPIGDLKILVKKNATGVRFIRKLYRNPFDPNGQWRYLYLHPGGAGFINPCANMTGGPAFTPFGSVGAGSTQGQVPVPGWPTQARIGGRPGGSYRSFNRDSQRSSMSALSAVDPNLFRATGMEKMNLPIVGVVNCENRESIRVYKGQTWINNWAFTPLAQGEYAGNVQRGGMAGAKLPVTGMGMTGAEFYPGFSGGQLGGGKTLQEKIEAMAPPEPPPEPPEEQKEEVGEEEDEDEDEDEEVPPSDPNQAVDPNHQADPNRQADPNVPSGAAG